ncbi:MAG: CHRD domain-containing protein [Rubrobacteraceae bacterium]|nr:CHRD domain-containing protein [Rubrobacteraceae bacterium]MDQ3437641.1 CHRD domain-containing protein [Actinomycetota bacterium]
MKKFVLVLAVVALGALVLVAPVTGAVEPTTLTTGLNGEEEVPGPGDPNGTGTATLTLDRQAGQICYQITVAKIRTATAAHIHEGPAGVAGPVVVGLEPPSDGSSEGCASVKRSLINDISRNPSNFYVNVHNAEYPAGAVRGQL